MEKEKGLPSNAFEKLSPADIIEKVIFEEIGKAGDSSYDAVIANNEDSPIAATSEQIKGTAETAKFDKSSDVALSIVKDFIGDDLDADAIINVPEFGVNGIARNIGMNMIAKVQSSPENIVIDENSSPTDIVWASVVEQSLANGADVTMRIVKQLVADLDINEVQAAIKSAAGKKNVKAVVAIIIADNMVKRKYANDSVAAREANGPSANEALFK